MRWTILGAGLLAVATLTGSALAQTAPAVAPRDVANAVATRVEENYFDPTRAHSIADGLRQRAAHGDYDRFANPLDLATALTQYLHPFDGHFGVTYRPPQPGAPNVGAPQHAGGPPGPPPGAAAAAARQNYGFRRAELLASGIGYIVVDQFAPIDPSNPNDPARRAADAALTMVQGARAIILDLRDSRGGAPAMVAYLASNFVAADANIWNTFHSRRGDQREAPQGDPTLARRTDVPLYILVNGGTGSASESFPYTLQAAHRATIVGEPSNGRANPGGFLPVDGGFAVFVSGGSPENPITHTNWEGTGVVPDVRVASADALNKAQQLALQNLLTADPNGDLAGETRWTLEALEAEQHPQPARDLSAYAGAYGSEMSVEAAGANLIIHQGRRATLLALLNGDTFYAPSNPTLRITFERTGNAVTAASLTSPRGPVARFQR